uniref:ABC transporter domain-containing protein n=1 Tax=Brassica oleracea var. oleracea TaxID=109376 RepID=A0A0D3AJV8_BRAOL
MAEGPAVILKIVDLPKDLDKDTIHSYGPDSFKLHRFPLPVPGKVLGLVGPHSVGKTTALKVLARELKPNFGRFDDSPDWPEIWTHFHRFELQRYFQILNMNLKLNKFLRLGLSRVPAEVLERVTLAIALLQKANVYIFDEISNSLDVHHRFKVAQLIRSLIRPDSYVIVVDNDLSVVDYVSDYMYCLYGEPGEYGVFAKKGWHVKAGIEHYLRGFDPVEKNLIRGEPLIFELEVKGGEFDDGQILLVLGDNGTGKSTFIRMLADLLPPDQVVAVQPWRPNFLPSYKPQKNELGSECTVRLLLERKRPIAKMHSRFVSDVMKPLQIYPLLDRKVATLSPGETQRVAITLCLATNANVYLIDEPSAYLDSDMRIKAAMAIRRHVLRAGESRSDKVILAERTPSAKFATSSPYPRVTGLDLFLKKMNMTFRRDTDTFRFTPRVNILGSAEDKDQKAAGVYYGLA